MRVRTRQTTLLVLLSFGVAASSGCSSFRGDPPGKRVLIRDGGARKRDAVEVVQGKIYPELIDLAEYAALSANAYDALAYKRALTFADFCGGNGDETFLEPLHWHEESDLPRPKPAPWGHIHFRGLRYQVWVREHPGSAPVAVIAFRGTVSEKGGGSWWSNLRWFTRGLPVWDEYDQAIEVVPRLVDSIQAKYGAGTVIVATGHSLGGGLAQLAGYISGDVKHVVGFDPSPVTAYFSVDAALRVKNKRNRIIYRIYQQGEILEYARWVMKRLWPLKSQHPRIVEVRFNLLPQGDPIARHSMKELACQLYRTSLAAGAPPAAAAR
jgi:hypothetical protein